MLRLGILPLSLFAEEDEGLLEGDTRADLIILTILRTGLEGGKISYSPDNIFCGFLQGEN
jgi:hypothetical protein